MTIKDILGEGTDLTILQMSLRGVLFFFVALVLIRISGRRSLGIHTSIDGVITIVLGSILARAIVGASQILPVVATCFVIVVMHRLISWAIAKKKIVANLIEGDKILLYAEGHFIKKGMDHALLSKEDIMMGVRKSALTDDLENIDRIYMERSGDISAVKKDLK